MNEGKTEIIRLLKELVSIPSINPMGREVVNRGEYYEGQISRYIEDYLKDAGIDVIKQKVSPDRYNIGGVVRKGKEYPTIIFQSHVDTVGFENGKEYLLGPVEKDGFIYGRGAADAKGGLACMLVALEYARDNIDKINKGDED